MNALPFSSPTRPALKSFLPLIALAALLLSACDALTDTATTADGEALLAEGEQVALCHATTSPDNPWKLERVDAPAVAAHEAHGDGFPGEAVPDMPGYLFNDACEPVEGCPCYTAADLAALTFDRFLDSIIVFEDEETKSTVLLGPSQDQAESGWRTWSDAPGFGECRLSVDGTLRGVHRLPRKAEYDACRALLYERAEDLDLSCESNACP